MLFGEKTENLKNELMKFPRKSFFWSDVFYERVNMAGKRKWNISRVWFVEFSSGRKFMILLANKISLSWNKLRLFTKEEVTEYLFDYTIYEQTRKEISFSTGNVFPLYQIKSTNFYWKWIEGGRYIIFSLC